MNLNILFQYVRWLSDQRADQLVLLILIAALTIKFTFFDDRNQTPQSLEKSLPAYILEEPSPATDMEKGDAETLAIAIA